MATKRFIVKYNEGENMKYVSEFIATVHNTTLIGTYDINEAAKMDTRCAYAAIDYIKNFMHRTAAYFEVENEE